MLLLPVCNTASEKWETIEVEAEDSLKEIHRSIAEVCGLESCSFEAVVDGVSLDGECEQLVCDTLIGAESVAYVTPLPIYHARKLLEELGHKPTPRGLLQAVRDQDKFLIQTTVQAGVDVNFTYPASPLFVAAGSGHISTVQQLLELGADPSLRVGCGEVALHAAAKCGSVEVVQLLVPYGSVECEGRKGTPLAVAASAGAQPTAELLLSLGADINSGVRTSETPLTAAVGLDNGFAKAIVQFLLASGANVHFANKEGRTPLAVAARRHQDTALLDILLEAGAVIDKTVLVEAFRSESYYSAMLPPVDVGANLRYLASHCGQGIENKLGTALVSAMPKIQGTLLYEMVSVAISEGADVNIEDSDDGLTPLALAVSFTSCLSCIPLLLKAGAVLSCTVWKAAAKHGSIEIMKCLLESENGTKDKEALSIALCECFRGSAHKAKAAMLLAAGADANYRSREGAVPLRAAGRRECVASIKLLLQHGAIPSGPCLHDCSTRQCIELLLNAGADPNARDKHGAAPLHHWASNYYEVEDEILSRPLDVKVLVRAGAKLNARAWGSTPLMLAVEENSLTPIRCLLEGGADPTCKNENGSTALHLAVLERVDTEVVRVLCEHGVCVNALDNKGMTPLHLVTSSEKVKALMEHGADATVMSNRGRTPLLCAVFSEHKEVVKELLPVSALDVADDDGVTALHELAKRGNEELVNKLLTAGASADVKDGYGRTALHLAAREGTSSIVRKLLVAGASVRSADKAGKTPLHVAAEEGDKVMLRLLLSRASKAGRTKKKGGPLNDANQASPFSAVISTSSEGETVLHCAVRSGGVSAVKLLLRAKVETKTALQRVTSAGKTPLCMAVERGFSGIVHALLEAGAVPNTAHLRSALHTDRTDIVDLLCSNDGSLRIRYEKELLWKQRIRAIPPLIFGVLVCLVLFVVFGL